MDEGMCGIPVIFLIYSFIWIFFSDYLIYLSNCDEDYVQFINTGKGIFFILPILALFYILIRQNQKHLFEKHAHLKRGKEEKKRLFGIMNMVKNYIMITDCEGRITWVNRAFEEHTGYKLKEIINRYPEDILSGEETAKEIIDQAKSAIEQENHCTFEAKYYTKFNERYWVEVHQAPLYNEDQKLTGFFSIQNNITSYRVAEQMLCDQNFLLSEIAWRTSHEVRKPVASILGLNKILQQKATIEEKEECFQMLNHCATDLDRVIKQINSKLSAIGH